jgi:hypothetical protein
MKSLPRTLLPFVLTASLQAALPLSYDLDGDGVAEISQGLVDAPPPVGAKQFASVWTGTNAFGQVLFSKSHLSVGGAINGSVGYGVGLPYEGYWGIQFPAADGIHYGWVQLRTPDLPVWGGVWVSRVFFHPEPGHEVRVGDASVILSLRTEPSENSVRLLLNTDASSFAGGLVIESRPALGGGNWSRVRTLAEGSTATLPLDAEARLYRVVQGP